MNYYKAASIKAKVLGKTVENEATVSYYVDLKNEEIEVDATKENAIALINVGAKQTQANNDYNARQGLPFHEQSFRVVIKKGTKPVLMPFYLICKNHPLIAKKLAENLKLKNERAFKKWETLYNYQANFKA